MVDGSLPDVDGRAVESGVEPAPSDVAVEDRPDHPTDQLSAAAPREARRPRRGLASVMFTLLRRLWIPLVVVIVVAAGGFTVSRLHGIFGSDDSLTYGDTATEESKPVDPKIMKYEVFGPPGTIAQISFFNGNGDPQFLEAVPLPWTLEFPITGAAGVGSVAAQGDSDSLGCRILVDDVVKSEKYETHEASTFAACMLKAA
ncbi:Siderophore export accessory protein MmpS4 [Mycolicibacterium parafortuitum]|uniref:Siderophore export accessory protein MmpS4 n=1 Tax=Mycolicibacterium parafortuitum TaxID=39692 RepID=A0A375YMG8_MYCPF|nr:Siderophore export accessory protein MmpS4 [Mycolicibacterium parafortuitum]